MSSPRPTSPLSADERRALELCPVDLYGVPPNLEDAFNALHKASLVDVDFDPDVGAMVLTEAGRRALRS